MENHFPEKADIFVTKNNWRQELGQRGEDVGCHYLEKKGYKILARRFRYRRAEIDIIACKGSVLVFIEVKTRRHEEFGYPEEAVKKAKKIKLKQVARVFLYGQKEKFSECRFDVLSILFKSESEYEITHFEDVL